jgi:hypothetical protein
MIHGITTIGVRFDVDKIDSGCYGIACWEIFWQAIAPQELPNTSLFEGDTSATMNGSENVFCIAVQGFDSDFVRKIKSALTESEKYRLVCARPNFVEGNECVSEPLPPAGRIDALGELIGDAWNARPALNSVKDKIGL